MPEDDAEGGRGEAAKGRPRLTEAAERRARARRDRLARALRRNLSKRKSQARARAAPEDED